MRFVLSKLLVLWLSMSPAIAGPFDPAQVASDAKWLIHLDVEALLKTKVGEILLKRISEEHLAGIQTMVKEKYLTDIDFTKLRGLTAYGTGYEDKGDESGVLILQAGQNVAALLRKLSEAGPDDSGKEVTALAKGTNGVELFSYNDEVYADALKDDFILLGKAKSEIAKAAGVIAGTSSNYKKKSGTSKFPNPAGSLFLLITAEQFNKDVSIPPQAKFLQKAESIRVLLGEQDERIFINIGLQAATEETTLQIRQVIDGMIALLRLSPMDGELSQLLNKITVTDSNQVVSVNLAFPSKMLIEKIAEN